MTRHRLLQDVNLSDIVFGNDGQALRLEFLNMQDGREVATIRCYGLLVLNFQSVLSQLPLYVGEVFHELVDAQSAAKRLKLLGYGFRRSDCCLLEAPSASIHLVHIEGGEIEITIVCSKVDVHRSNFAPIAE